MIHRLPHEALAALLAPIGGVDALILEHVRIARGLVASGVQLAMA